MTTVLDAAYLGQSLRSPIIASSSPATGSLDRLRELDDAGVGAVVLPSLFEEQVEHDAMELQRLADLGTHSFPEAVSGYHQQMPSYSLVADKALQHLANAKATLDVPVIASLNGTTDGGWVRYAKWLEEAGADAIELNVYLIPTDADVAGSDVEKRYVEVVASVREQVSVPLAVKIGPYFSSTAHVATQLVEAGADGLVLFNRFYQPDIDLEELTVVPNLKLSHSDELRLPLRWTAILANVVDCDLAVTSGVHTAADALKAVIVGADVVMMASAVLHHGAKRVTDVLLEMHAWLAEHDYESLDQLRGSMTLDSAPDAAAFVRANYLQVLASYTPTRHR